MCIRNGRERFQINIGIRTLFCLLSKCFLMCRIGAAGGLYMKLNDNRNSVATLSLDLRFTYDFSFSFASLRCYLFLAGFTIYYFIVRMLQHFHTSRIFPSGTGK